MYQKMKYVIAVAVIAMFASGQALACGGAKGCMSGQAGTQTSKECPMQKDCPMKKDRPMKKDCQMGKGSAYKGHGYSHAKKHHTNIPGKSTRYVHKILRRGDEIGLSDTQRRQIEDILIAAEKEGAEARARAEAVAAEFYGKLKAGKVNDNEIGAYASRMGELHAARLKANLSASLRASSMLSAEQKAKLYAGKKDKGARQ